MDEGYWKEHNQEAEPSDNEGEEIEYDINLTSIHNDINIDFTAQTFRKLADGKISISAEVAYPADVNLIRYRIEVAACSTHASGPYNLPTANQNTTFNRNSVELSQIADQPNLALEGQYLYVYGTIGAGGTTQVRIACSEITR